MRLLYCAAFILAFPAVSLACSDIQDDAERLSCYDARFNDIELIRCINLRGSAECEIITPGVNDMVSCTAFDADRNPVAKSSAFGAAGLTLPNIDAGIISHVECEQIM